MVMRGDSSLSVSEVLTGAYQSGGTGPFRTRHRSAEFFEGRFTTQAGLAASGLALFRYTGDLQFSTIRAGLWAPHLLGLISDETIASLVLGFGEVLDRY